MKNLFLILMISSLSFVSTKLVADTNNSTTPAPHINYKLFFTINAEHGFITKLADDDYQLALENTHKNITYLYNISPKKSGTVLTKKFITLLDNKIVRDKDKNKTIEANLTGVQIDQQTIGHQQLYYVVKLTKPRYETQNPDLFFRMTLVAGTPTIGALEKLENATLFINGCDICSCYNHTVKCDAGFLN